MPRPDSRAIPPSGGIANSFLELLDNLQWTLGKHSSDDWRNDQLAAVRQHSRYKGILCTVNISNAVTETAGIQSNGSLLARPA